MVPNRDSTIFYIENNENKKRLILVEFNLVDDKKDIIFKSSNIINIKSTTAIKKKGKISFSNSDEKSSSSSKWDDIFL